MFDSSVARGEPITFILNQVIKGWTEGVQLMVQGEKRRFWIPGELAYGEKSGMLVFDVELLSIEGGTNAVPAPAPAPAPEPTAPADLPAPADVAAPPATAQKTASGLASRVITAGTGTVHPTATSKVKVHYTGWTTAGKMFDSSVTRGEPTTFGLNQVIKGWTEGVQLMVVGEKRRFWIPSELAYKNGVLVFDVELLGIESAPPAPAPKTTGALAPPADVAAPPANAQRTASGLASKVLRKGNGTIHPNATHKVKVHYTGWMTNGKMFDSSVTRGKPLTFGLNQVILGWTEGLQLMVVGEKRRFWIPGRLAYGDTPSQTRPYGTLVFDVELLTIEQ